MKKLFFYSSIFLALLISWSTSLKAQNYTYSVSTLLPEASHIIDDGLCLDEKGVLYGSYWGIWQGAAGTHIARYRSDNVQIDTLAVGFIRPNGMSYKDGKVYVANGGTGSVLAIDTSGEVSLIVTIPGGVSNVLPQPDSDQLIATAWGGKTIYNIDTNGLLTPMIESELFNGPVGAAYDDEGILYIGNFNDGKIIMVKDNQAEVFADLKGGIGFLTYSQGSILATNHTDKKVYSIDIATQEIEVIAGSGEAVIRDGVGTAAAFRSPNGIVATSSGDTIYVSEFAGKALRMIVRTSQTTTNTSNILQDLDFQIFPNPAIDRIQLSYSSLGQIQKGIITDNRGRVVLPIELEELRKKEIDLSRLSSGIYYLSLYNKQGKSVGTLKFPVLK
ncbi:MAG: T9SS type A sorting domain-containing protein [Bacteroidota bacterium]